MSIVGERLNIVIDSRVVFGAWAKGRSSSKQLNHVVRSGIGPTALSQKPMFNTWACSEDNLGDEPFGVKPLRALVPVPVNISVLHDCTMVVPLDMVQPIRCLTRRRVRGRRRVGTSEAVGSVRHPSLKQFIREYKRCDSPLWGRDVSEINDELTSSLTSGGLPMRVPLGFSAQSTRSVHVLDLDREDAFEILLTEVCLGYYMLLCFRLPWHQPGMFARPSLLKQEFTLKSPVAQYLLAGFAHGQHWDLFERLVERRVELPDEASQKIFMSLAIAKKTDALEWLITCGAVVIHASFTLKSPIAQYLLAGFAQGQH
jgi:hypothetical protein